MPAVVAAVQITSPAHHDASQMRETFYNLAAAKANNGGKIDAATEEEVNQILKLVGERLMAALWEDRDAAQRAYNGTVTEVNGCNTDLTGRMLPIYEHWKSNTAQDRDMLDACLRGENDICGEMNRVCDDLDQYVCDFELCNDHALNNNACVDCKETEPTNSDLYKSLQCLINFDARYYNVYIAKREACRQQQAAHRAKTADCDRVQKQLENTKCQEQGVIRESCGVFNGCWTSAMSAHDSTTAATKELENIFQKQWTALECLMCYGKEILAESTNLTACENADAPVFTCTMGSDTDRVVKPTTSLAICYYEPEIKEDCEAQYDYCVPGADSWFDKYSDFVGTCAVVDEVPEEDKCLQFASS